ncbi:hypothetical protein ACIRBX_03215 [Kitasatospora sp. NPDC096147]|uniref:hypothetical protein n=1 Tax=Kitasatospora sp. NPDC096147 TaxID=3364093 RepID=UPI0038227624
MVILRREARDEWWAGLPAGIREEIDGYVCQDAMLGAVRVITAVGFRIDGIGVGCAQLIAGDRYAHYADRVAGEPDSPLDPESLARKAAGCEGRVVAVEAVWDGDTVHDWFVILRAVIDGPESERSLASVYQSTAERFLEAGAGAGASASAVTGRRPAAAVAAERAGRRWPSVSACRSTSPAPTSPTTRRRAGAPRSR